MRIIEQNMVAAIKDRANWHEDNTVVCEHVATGKMQVLLHGNTIAVMGDTLSISLAGWNTPTTRSRLNALLQVFGPAGARVFVKMGKAYYTDSRTSDCPMHPDVWVTVGHVSADEPTTVSA